VPCGPGRLPVLSWRLAVADGVALVAGTDITRERFAEEAARRLEQHVAQRTAALTVITEELEVFDYSVSQDLRAPLRAIDGFSAVLARQSAERLDDSGQEMLERVRHGVAKLNELIDAMLILSRLSRQDLRLRHVDLSDLAREVISGLRERDPRRNVEVVVADGLSAVGDRSCAESWSRNFETEP
jgi:light-regulated signal transduction histidine kinase (bacteriophytochrome)